MTKAELRKIYLAKRKSISEAEYLQLNHQLCENFFALVDLSFIRVLHTFIPIEKNREPNTWLIIDRIRREFPHIRLSIPKINTETGGLENFFLEGMHQLTLNTWGILEPKQGIPTEPEKIDMVLVPMLTFDMNGQRVGYGKGFYDRFLATCRPTVKSVGLSLYEPVEIIQDIEDHDVPLTYCVTPTQAFSFQS
ncbi:5-formyltetrahydrofolate cyclo-ligase [Ohtaekwangia kribbensis]|jgi:5-formyltetrahydrofolate cyclo-ligase|uniref:5-formyltetrahydrofolate cyclo-ligase n=1 Tax=Ohtaekwangia kribbensis TaxID=688913 RepID=A0ABW3K1L3_9BACT